MKNGKNSNKLNGILNIINISSDNQIQKKNKTSYYKFFISNKPLKITKSASLNIIYIKKEKATNSKLQGYLYLKDLENSKYINYKKYFIKNNKSNKIINKNSSTDKYKTIQKNENNYIKKYSSLPYLYRNLHKKNVSNRFLNIQRIMNSTDIGKFQINNIDEFSLSHHLKNNYIDKNDSKLINNKLKHIYNNTKYNKINKIKIMNNNDKKIGFINRIDLGKFLKKNNSVIDFNSDKKMNYNYDINENILSYRGLKKEKQNKKNKNNNYFNGKKDIEIKNFSKTLLNPQKKPKIQKIKWQNLINKNIKLNIKNSENSSRNLKINNINDKYKESILQTENKIFKNVIKKNNSKNELSIDYQNDRETISTNKNEFERRNNDEIEKDIFISEDQEKLFNTNQKNFYKFRKDIKEEPDLEEDID